MADLRIRLPSYAKHGRACMISSVDNTTRSLTGLLTEFGALWEIISSPHGFTAQRRPAPVRPLVFIAATVPALRALLEHGYDTGKLARIMRDFSSKWEIERIDPGAEWIAVTRHGGPLQMIAAPDLDSLRRRLSLD
jgi:hypothetical protein